MDATADENVVEATLRGRHLVGTRISLADCGLTCTFALSRKHEAKEVGSVYGEGKSVYGADGQATKQFQKLQNVKQMVVWDHDFVPQLADS